MTKLIHDNSAPFDLRAYTTEDADLAISVSVADPLPTVTDRDAILELPTGGYDITPSPSGGVSFESLTPEVAVVCPTGRVTALADGEALIAVSAPHIRRGVRLPVSLTNRRFLAFVDGSLAAHCSEAVDSRIVGRDPATAKAIFATQDHVASVYVRNPACWCADVDLTCLSPWNSEGGNNKAGTLISPRHILFAKHYRIATGATIRFVTADDQLIERTMTARHDVAEADLCAGLLDGDVPASIGFARVLPADTGSYLPGVAHRVPGLLLDQEEKALVGDLNKQSFNSFAAPTEPQRLAFNEEIIDGDSGNPAFLLIDTGDGVEPVLATTWTGGGGGSGPNISALHDEINAAMTALGGGYQLMPANLGGFPSYE